MMSQYACLPHMGNLKAQSHRWAKQGWCQEIAVTMHAFAARRKDGMVFCWGLAAYGGHSAEAHLRAVPLPSIGIRSNKPG
eukprot:Skav221903  [mRNA]  locus=scaffold1395:880645:880884:- [translate_table: standard]